MNENDDTLTPAKKCVEAGRYLYEIQLTDEAAERYDIKNRYDYTLHYATDPKTPNIDEYDNIGFMDIKAGSTESQKPIYFMSGAITKKVTDAPFTNPLTNPNASDVTYSSSNTAVLDIDPTTGEATVTGAGTATVTAVSEKAGTTPVYARYTRYRC